MKEIKKIVDNNEYVKFVEAKRDEFDKFTAVEENNDIDILGKKTEEIYSELAFAAGTGASLGAVAFADILTKIYFSDAENKAELEEFVATIASFSSYFQDNQVEFVTIMQEIREMLKGGKIMDIHTYSI